jgi:hypothetical protein
MMPPCKNCCILPSCKRKFDLPTKCSWRPALLPRFNASQDIANLGRKRIALSGGVSNTFRAMAQMEHRIRLSLCEGWE